jgi:hypothetical protein
LTKLQNGAAAMSKRSVAFGALSAALLVGGAYKYIQDEKAAHPLKKEFAHYTAPIAYDKRPYYQQSRPTPHVAATAETLANGLIAGASFFANDYCPDLSYTGSLSRLRWYANEVTEDTEYSRLKAEIHTSPRSIDAMCAALLAKYSNYLYTSKVSHKWVSNNLRDPHMFGIQNDWKMGRHSGLSDDRDTVISEPVTNE